MKKSKKNAKNEIELFMEFEKLQTDELRVRKLIKGDFDYDKGYYELAVMKEDFDSIYRNQVYIPRQEYQKHFGPQLPDGNTDYY